MGSTTRREFVKKAALAATFAAPAMQIGRAQDSPNERVNVAVVGFHGRGRAHIEAFSEMKNARIVALCDVDERLFPAAVKEVEEKSGHRPDTEVDIRKLLERKDLDAVSIATPDYWHALMTIWACQAGKDVYVEKPVSFTIEEGGKMVEAARKYKRIVQAGLQSRSEGNTRAAMRLLNDGQLGKVYRSKINIVKPRGSIGHKQEASIPEGVNWDLYLGPTKYQPFNVNRFHYGWHFFWDTSTTDVGNSAVHSLDLARWGLGKKVHPVKIHSWGGVHVWDSDQQTPNVQNATFEYADGTLLDMELTNVYSPKTGAGLIYFTDKGYLQSTDDGWETAIGEFSARSGRPDVTEAGVDERVNRASFPQVEYKPGPAIVEEPVVNHFENFVACVRSRKVEDQYCDVQEGHLSAALAHQANISYRLGRQLVFDPKTERFVNDDEANQYLTREYRAPYVLPKEV
ncbi:MAG: Gfo/Idh/MocA family oxidoreductase [Bryobacterales bacterium]